MALLLWILVFLLLAWILSRNAYGYSLWYVPVKPLANWTASHIPHITIVSGLKTPGQAKQKGTLFPRRVQVYPRNRLELFPKMYSDDPLDAYGVYVDLQEPVLTSFPLHLSLDYTNNLPRYSRISINPFQARLCVADTRDYDSKKWSIVSCF